MPNNLYEIQDSDRPMYILADSWNAALVKWQEIIAVENGPDHEDFNPLGIRFVAAAYDVAIA